MPDTLKFCGLTAESIRSTLGFNDQGSVLSLTLIQADEDYNLCPPVGNPVYCQYGAFSFNGILQKIEDDLSTSGRKLNVQIADCRSLLSAQSIIIGGYNGPIFTIPNIINCYGHIEQKYGFGSANVTSAGMPWYLIKQAINELINIPADGPFGGPINYRGVRYSVDLTDLPPMPAFYRISGNSVSLMDAISQVCRDGNCDFFVSLNGFSIKINCINKSRLVSPNTLRDWVYNVSLNSNIAISGSFGIEDAPNETTSAILAGAEVEDLFEGGTIASFWGYDTNNNPIFGKGGYQLWVPLKGNDPSTASYDFRNGKDKFPAGLILPRCYINKTTPNNATPGLEQHGACDQRFGAGDAVYTYGPLSGTIEIANLNSSIISDVVQSTVYPCSTLEFRAALTSLGTWEDFILKMRPDIYERIYGVKGQPLAQKNNLPNNADNTDTTKNRVKQDINKIAGDVADERLQKLYSFVRHYAEEFFGRKYAVSLPVIATIVDPETLQFRSAADITNSAYKVEGSQPLGLNALNETIFTDANGKFSGFCTMFAPGCLFDTVSASGAVIQGNLLYQKVNFDDDTIKTNTGLVGIFTVSAPLQENPEGVFGQIEVAAALRNYNMLGFKNGLPMFANFDGYAPDRRPPLSVAVPLKSNLQTYGPWWVNGNPGKTEFIKDDSISPWNFGGYDAMNAYAYAVLGTIRTTGQNSESGQLRIAGAPMVNLGQILNNYGPVLTDVSCEISASGITTSYTFRIHSYRNGTLGKQFVDRVRSISLASQKIRRDLKNSIKEAIALRQIASDNIKAIRMEQITKKELQRKTPHDVISCNFYNKNIDNQDFTTDRHNYAQIAPLKEALTMINVDDDDRYKLNTVMSLNGIFAPFTMDNNTPYTCMPHTASISTFSSNILTWQTYNHFANNSIDIIGIGTTYNDCKPDSTINVADLKPVALRGPLWINGYGLNLKDLNGFTTDATQEIPSNWMVGPTDLIFDNYRGVWTPHTSYIGIVGSTIPKASTSFKTTFSKSDMGSGNVILKGDSPGFSNNVVDPMSGLNVSIPCKNIFSKDITTGALVTIAYNPHYNCFIVVSADCV